MLVSGLFHITARATTIPPARVGLVMKTRITVMRMTTDRITPAVEADPGQDPGRDRTPDHGQDRRGASPGADPVPVADHLVRD